MPTEATTFIKLRYDGWQEYVRRNGIARLEEWLEYLVCANEPLVAQRVLDDVPATIAGHPAIAGWRKFIGDRLAHLESFEAYKAAYATSFDRADEHGHDLGDELGKLDRFRLAIEWAKTLTSEGPPVHCLIVAGQTGYLEAALLTANPRIVTTSSELAPQAQPWLAKLAERFPGRVAVHQVKDHHYDWFGRKAYDAIFCYEVLEHLPSDEAAMGWLAEWLAPGGKLWLSVPNATFAPHLLDQREVMFEHVRSFNPDLLTELAKRHGLAGPVKPTDGGATILAILQRRTT